MNSGTKLGLWSVRTVVVGSLFAASAAAQDSTHRLSPDRVQHSGPIETLAGFVENRGQWPDEVLYFARAGGVDATLTRDAIVLHPTPSADDRERPIEPGPIVLRLPRSATAQPGTKLPTVHNFFLGVDSSRWASHVPGYDRVTYRDVAPGVDLILRRDESGHGFAYDVRLAPGASLDGFALEVDGATAIASHSHGVLGLETPSGRVEQRIGATWQEDLATGERDPTDAAFANVEPTAHGMRFGFAVPNRDPARSLVIDPTLSWATYIGGVGGETLRGHAVDPTGAVYLAAYVGPTAVLTPGAYDTTYNGQADAWAAKLSPDGKTLVWATLFGGSMADVVFGLVLAPDGGVIVGGQSWSSNFPTTPQSLQPTFVGTATKDDLFITKLSPDGASLMWSTYYGGVDYEDDPAFAIFPNGDVLLASPIYVADPPATPGAFDTTYNTKDLMLARLSADGTARIFQTYFSASRILDVVIDEADNIYFAGDAGADSSKPVPVTPGAFQTTWSGTEDAGFVAKLNGSGTQLEWATYLNGVDSLETIWGIAVDAAHAVYVCGQTGSDDFPTTLGAYSNTIGQSGYHGFVTKLLPRGSGLVWSTYFGTTCCNGGGYERDLAVDSAGNVYSVGNANEPVYPTTPDALQPNYVGPFPFADSHLAKFDAFGEQLIYSSWFGKLGNDWFVRIGMSPDEDPIMIMQTTSTGLPTTPGAYDSTYAGSEDLFIASFDFTPLPWKVLGPGKPGPKDIPNLAGGGWLTPGSPARISMRGAAPSASALLFAGYTSIDAPVLGGTFVPSPDIIVPITLNATGGLDLLFPWPQVPSGIDLYLQVWVTDPGATFGWSATNALRLTSQ